MPRPRTVNDLYVVNGWWLEIAGLQAPHFMTVEGVGIDSGTVSTVDGGDNTEYKFSDQLYKFGELTLTRAKDGSVDDALLETLHLRCIREGFKFPCELVKTHNGVEVFRIVFEGFRLVTNKSNPFDVSGSDKLTTTFTATADKGYYV